VSEVRENYCMYFLTCFLNKNQAILDLENLFFFFKNTKTVRNIAHRTEIRTKRENIFSVRSKGTAA
jgi:hypothetical protein